MKALWLEDSIAYDGSQLRAHWILRTTGIAGDAMVAFRGPCNVRRDEIADLADVDGPGIAGDDMLHFVWEEFSHTDLLLAVHRQRLLSATAAELVRERAPHAVLRRDGDDLYVGNGKLSISIATASPVSALLHFGINIVTSGTPVPTAGLTQLGVEPRAFARRLLEVVVDEQLGMAVARAKVRAKGEWTA